MIKLRFRATYFLSAIFLCVALLSAAQDLMPDQNAPTVPAPKPQFFAGTVTEIDAQHLKVSRTLVGRPTEVHSFIVNASTKMNKNLIKLKTHVTVRYRRQPEGDMALEIQPKPVVRPPKPNPL